MSGCLGFEPDDPDRFQMLRPGGGTPIAVGITGEPDVDGEPIIEWGPPAGDPFSARLYQLDERFDLWIEGDWYSIEPNLHRIGIPAAGDPVVIEQRLWGLPSVLTFIADGDLSLHASAAQVGGAAVALCGPSRHGKTTLAIAFQQAGHRMLSGDLLRVSVEGPAAHLYPGPAGLRVRRDTAEWADLGWPTIAEDADRVHISQPHELRGTAEPVPIGAIVLLKGEGDDIEIEPVEPVEAIRDLWFLSFHLPTDPGRAAKMRALADLTDAVPVYNLTRPLRFDSLGGTVLRIADLIDRD